MHQPQLIISRVFATVLALPFTAYAALTLRMLFIVGPRALLSLIVGSAALLAAALLWCFAAFGHIPRARTHILHVFVGAAILGGISFFAGFVGPIVFTPQSNQGPFTWHLLHWSYRI